MAIALGVMAILAAIIMPNALQFARKRQVESAVRQTYTIQDGAKWFWISHVGRKIVMGKNVFGSRDLINRPQTNLPVTPGAPPSTAFGKAIRVGPGGVEPDRTLDTYGCVKVEEPSTGVEVADRFCNARLRWGAYVEARDQQEGSGIGYKLEGLAATALDNGNRDSLEYVPTDQIFSVDEATGYWPGQLDRNQCHDNIDASLAKQELAPYLGFPSARALIPGEPPFTNPWHEPYDLTLDDCTGVAGCPPNPEKENCWFTVSTNVPEVHSTFYKRYLPLGQCINEDGNVCPGAPGGIPPAFTRCCTRIPWPGKETRFREWRPILQTEQLDWTGNPAEGWYCAPWETDKSPECEE